MSTTNDDASYQFFRTIPWCAKILDKPNYRLRPTLSRAPKDSSEDSFIAETLKTDRTIRRWITMHADPDPSLNPLIQEAFCLMELGGGLNGYPNICHGGFVATMLDEVMGELLVVNHENYAEQTGQQDGGMITQMTAYLNVSYKRPVPTPSIILATAKITKTEARKWFVESTIEDSEGQILAKGEALFLHAKVNPRM